LGSSLHHLVDLNPTLVVSLHHLVDDYQVEGSVEAMVIKCECSVEVWRGGDGSHYRSTAEALVNCWQARLDLDLGPQTQVAPIRLDLGPRFCNNFGRAPWKLMWEGCPSAIVLTVTLPDRVQIVCSRRWMSATWCAHSVFEGG
jgi:hypothetical protein